MKYPLQNPFLFQKDIKKGRPREGPSEATRLLLIRVALPIRHIRGVEKLFGFLGAIATEIVGIKLNDIGVVVRLTNGLLVIDVIKDGSPFLTIGIQDILVFIRK